MVGDIYKMDNDTTYVWLTNQLYTGAAFQSVSWYNEANGAP